MLKGFYRDKVSLFFAILFPQFFIVIFGAIFSGGEAARPIVVEVGAVPLIDQLPADAKAGLVSAVELVRGSTMNAALQQVQKGDVAAALTQDGDTLRLDVSAAQPVIAASVQGVFSSFVDQTNVAVSGAPPTYALQTGQVEDQSFGPSSTSRRG